MPLKPQEPLRPRKTLRSREQQIRITITGALLLGFCLLALPSHAVWQWMRGAALTDFEESDWEILRETAREVLDNRPDREQVNWSNPETGNRGSIIALATFSHEGRKCRRAAMRNLTFRGRDDKAAYSLCQQADGDWIFVSESALIADSEAPAADRAPAADKEPSADKEPAADRAPAAGKAPAADRAPAADKEPSADRETAADQETLTP